MFFICAFCKDFSVFQIFFVIILTRTLAVAGCCRGGDFCGEFGGAVGGGCRTGRRCCLGTCRHHLCCSGLWAHLNRQVILSGPYPSRIRSFCLSSWYFSGVS